MSNNAWSHLGINDESLFLSLFYDPHTDSLISQFYRKIAEHHGVKSLYVRKSNEIKYHRLTESSDVITYEDVLLASNKPLLFLNSLEARIHNGEYSGYDWGSFKVISLEDNKVLAEIKGDDLGGGKGSCTTWISKVHNVAPNGEFAICSLGITELKSGGENVVNYHLAKI